MRPMTNAARRRWRNLAVVVAAAVLMWGGASRMPTATWGYVWIAGVVVVALLVMRLADRMDSRRPPRG